MHCAASYQGDWQCGQLLLPPDRNHLKRHEPWNAWLQVLQSMRGSEWSVGCRTEQQMRQGSPLSSLEALACH